MERPFRMRKLFGLVAVLLGIFLQNCQEPIARRPINHRKEAFLNQSALRNKNRIALEQQLFHEIRKNEPNVRYQNSSKGFWYAIIKGINSRKPLPQKGDEVVLEYRIEDLNKNLLYDEEQLGQVRFLVDQEDYLAALREGAKVLREGQTGVFLFPSYLCFGYQGDFEKIGSNQPLRFTIKLVSLTKINS